MAHFFVRIADRVFGLELGERTVDGRPGLVAEHAGTPVAVYAFDIAGDRIRHVRGVLNPETLRPWAP
ncbi:hypothetical protein ACIRFH_20495 [Streptomyces sp. NPDC093586]|uniref:hypothetical protein n=1 Tax=Streptomyces sp. NPDC093586 TaxID=3366042 RepID=UPI003809F56F